MGEAAILARVVGCGAAAVFAGERGEHRWQHVRPDERDGRLHTSTVTVAVLTEPTAEEFRIDPGDLDETYPRTRGKNCWHQDTTRSAVTLRHIPTGTVVRVDCSRDRAINRETALAVLRARLFEAERVAAVSTRNDQVGCGDKVRTIAVQRGSVTDHATGKSMPLERYLRGHLADLK